MTLTISKDEIQNNILAIGSSPRAGGNSDLLLQHFCTGANKVGVETEEIQLRDLEFTPCVGCELCRKSGECSRFDDDLTAIYPKIVESRGIFLISPVHNYNVTAWMKGFIDRLYSFYNFSEPRPGHWDCKLDNQGRKAVVAAVCEQNDKKDMGFTLEAMQMPLEALGYEVLQAFPVLGVFDKGKVTDHPDILQTAESIGEELANRISD